MESQNARRRLQVLIPSMVTFLVLFSVPTRGADVPQMVTILGEGLNLQKVQEQGADIVAEYIPPSETLAEWTKMFSARIMRTQLTPEQAAQAIKRTVAARKARGDSLATSVVFANGEARLVDFGLSEGWVVEHDTIRYSRTKDGRLVAFQIGCRLYQPLRVGLGGLTAFVRDLETTRNARVAEIDRVAVNFFK